MDLVLPHRFVRDLHQRRLPGWVGLSLAAHVLVLSFSGGMIGPAKAPHRQTAMTVEISHLAAEPLVALPALEPEIKAEASTRETAAALAVPAPIPEVPARSTAPATPPAVASQQATDRPNGPDSGGASSLPFAAYFAVSDVDVRAEPINEVLLQYPSAAYIQRISGVVQFRLFISEQGVLDKAELIDANPKGIFENAAWDAVRKLQFSPARKNGRPVSSQKTIDVVFEPYEDLKPAVKRKDSSVAEK